MKLNEVTRGMTIWRSNEEQAVLEKITEPTILEGFEEHEQVIIDALVRKSLLIKVQGKHSTYIYPNV